MLSLSLRHGWKSRSRAIRNIDFISWLILIHDSDETNRDHRNHNEEASHDGVKLSSLFGLYICKKGARTHKVAQDNANKLRARAQLPQSKPGLPHNLPLQRAPRAPAPPRKRENPMNRQKKLTITPTKFNPLATTHAIKITKRTMIRFRINCSNVVQSWMTYER